LFTPKFCMPARATEKPRVENRVYDLERQWATPVPQVKDLAELNAHLRRCCLAARQRCCGDNTSTVAARFAENRAKALVVPRVEVRCLRDAKRAGGQVPDHPLRQQPLQRLEFTQCELC
jgi:hypothetical protein